MLTSTFSNLIFMPNSFVLEIFVFCVLSNVSQAMSRFKFFNFEVVLVYMCLTLKIGMLLAPSFFARPFELTPLR
jgi:hypothetical protein